MILLKCVMVSKMVESKTNVQDNLSKEYDLAILKVDDYFRLKHNLDDRGLKKGDTIEILDISDDGIIIREGTMNFSVNVAIKDVLFLISPFNSTKSSKFTSCEVE